MHLLEGLGEFTRNDTLTVFTECITHIGERVVDAVAGFIKNQRPRFARQCLESGQTRAVSARQEALEDEAVRRQAGNRQRRRQRTGTRDGTDGNACRLRGARQTKTRIADKRSPGIRYQCNRLAGAQRPDQRLGRFALVVFVECDHGCGDTVVTQQALAVPRVFGSDPVNARQHLQGALTDVFQVTYRCCNNVQYAGLDAHVLPLLRGTCTAPRALNETATRKAKQPYMSSMKTSTIAAIVRFTKYPALLPLTSVLLAVLLLVGCAAPPVKTAPPVDAERLSQAETLQGAGEYRAAAELYLSLAGETTAPLSHDLQLAAIESLLAGGDMEQARTLLDALPADLNAGQTNRVRLARAESALLDNQAEAALELLSTPLENPAPEQETRYHRLRASAHSLRGNYVSSIEERIWVDAMLTPGAERQANQLALWQDLMRLDDPTRARLEATSSSEALIGWLSLATLVRQHQQEPARLAEHLSDWQLRHPSHPAVAGGIVADLQAGIARISQYPHRIGVLLPSTGPWAQAAAAVRDGMLAAYYDPRSSANRPALHFYDIGADPGQTWARYQEAVRDGMSFVIGPLRKESVTELARAITLEIPVLALNTTESADPTPVNLYRFSLAPEDEARQLAEQARSDSYAHALAILPDGPWGERVLAAFAARWQALGGELLEVQRFGEEQKELSNRVSKLLNIDDSKRRHRNLTAALGKKLEFEPRRRQDADFVLLVAPPERARLLRPLLRFHRASDLPVLATSYVYAGYPDATADADMNGVVFCDMPWVLSDGDEVAPLRQSFDEAMPDRPARYTRFYAMGIDAYKLVPYLPELGRGTFQWYRGVTGDLSVDDERDVHRSLLWAQFQNGVPQRVQVATPSVPGSARDDNFPRQDDGPEPATRREADNDATSGAYRDRPTR